MSCLPVMPDPCQMTQSISRENQSELVREPANLLSGKLSKDSSTGQVVLRRGALLGLGPVSCCSWCLGPLGTHEVPRS